MKFTEEFILKYLNGELSPEEIQAFEAELKVDNSLDDLYQHHVDIHKELSTGAISSPSPNFIHRVMKSVATLNFSEAKFFNKTRLYVLILVSIAVATTLYYISSKFYPEVGGAISNEITLKEFTLNLQPAQQLLSSDILFKVVFYVNGLISLLLLDRAIIKPYFARRKQRYAM